MKRGIIFEKFSLKNPPRLGIEFREYIKFSALFPLFPPLPPNPLYRTDFCRSRGGIAILFPHRLPPLLRSDSVAERSLETRTIKSFSFTSESTIPVPSYISPSPLVYASRPFSRAISFLSFSSLSGIRSRWYETIRKAEPTTKLIDRIAMTRRGEKKERIGQERSFDKQIGWGGGVARKKVKRCYRTCAKERKEKQKTVNVGEGERGGSERREWFNLFAQSEM